MASLERPSQAEVDRLLQKYGRIRRRIVDWDLRHVDYKETEAPCDGEVVPLIRDDEDRLAVVRQRQGPEHFTLPTGRIQPGEGVEAASLREALEETGFHIRVEEVPAIHRIRVQWKRTTGERWFFVVLCRVELREGQPRDQEEIAEVRFIRLPGEMPPEWARSEWYLWVLKDASLLHPHSFLVGKAKE